MTREEYIQKITDAQMDILKLPSMPKCCAGCEHLAEDGLCKVFNQYPPLEYLKTPSNCPEWLILIPF